MRDYHIYLVGGFTTRGEHFGGIEQYDILKNQWHHLDVALNPNPRSGIQTIPGPDSTKFYIIGGKNNFYAGNDAEVQEFDIQRQQQYLTDVKLERSRWDHLTFTMGRIDKTL